jgi:ubiquinone/menaquinone biosynthesis C-methylase UbiE
MDISGEEILMKKLDADWRKNILPPEQTLRRMGLSPGKVLADIGCGTGYFALPGASVVTEKGWVYAADISLRMLEELARRMEAEQLRNITPIHTDGRKLPIEDGRADFVLTSFVLHEVEDKAGFVSEMVRITRPGGAVAVIEWAKHEMPFGPDVNDRLSMDQTAAFLKNAGLTGLERYILGGLYYGVKGYKR